MVALGCLCIALGIVVDPYRVYGTAEIKDWTALKPRAFEQSIMAKIYALKRVAPVTQGKDKKDKIRIEVLAPGLKEVVMSCCCNKFVPVVTPYETKDKKERLIVAVMVCPCPCQ